MLENCGAEGKPTRLLTVIRVPGRSKWIVLSVVLVAVGSCVIVPIEPRSSRVLLASSLHTNVDDLARFALELLPPQRIDVSTRDMLLEPQIEVGRGIAWGAGIVVLTNTGEGLDNLIGNLGGYNLSKEIARQAPGIRGTWDLRRDAPK